MRSSHMTLGRTCSFYQRYIKCYQVVSLIYVVAISLVYMPLYSVSVMAQNGLNCADVSLKSPNSRHVILFWRCF